MNIMHISTNLSLKTFKLGFLRTKVVCHYRCDEQQLSSTGHGHSRERTYRPNDSLYRFEYLSSGAYVNAL